MSTWSTSWEATPSGTQSPTFGDDHIRDVKLEVRYRFDQEHVILGTASTGESIHRAGSARVYFQTLEPTLRPDGVTSIDSSDSGRIWIDSNDSNRLYVYNGDAAAFEEVSVGLVDYTGNLSITGYLTVGGDAFITGTISTGGEDNPDTVDGGLCLYSDANSSTDYLITLKDSHVAHGITGYGADTDTFGVICQGDYPDGGLEVRGYGEDKNGLLLSGVCTVEDTNQGLGTSEAPVIINGAVKWGVAQTSVANGSSVLAVKNNGDTVFIIAGDGDVYMDGILHTYDDEDDYGLVKAVNNMGREMEFTHRLEELGIIKGGKISLKRLLWLQLGTLCKLINERDEG